MYFNNATEEIFAIPNNKFNNLFNSVDSMVLQVLLVVKCQYTDHKK